jgi:hypothetical protein
LYDNWSLTEPYKCPHTFHTRTHRRNFRKESRSSSNSCFVGRTSPLTITESRQIWTPATTGRYRPKMHRATDAIVSMVTALRGYHNILSPVRNFLLTQRHISKGGFCGVKRNKKETPWHESASELYRPSHRRLSAKLVPIFADRGCLVVSVTDPYGRILGFLYRSRYFFFQVAPQLYSRG